MASRLLAWTSTTIAVTLIATALVGNRPGQVALRVAAAALLVAAVLLIFLQYPAEAQSNDRATSNLAVSSPNPGELAITWDAPGNAPDDYRVTWKKSDGRWHSYKNANTALGGNAFPTGTSHTVTGLEEGTAYKARVRARYFDGNGNLEHSGPWSDAAEITISATPSQDGEGDSNEGPSTSPPAKPTGLITAASHDSVMLSWTDPDDDSITGYQVLRGDDADNLATLADDTGSASTSYTDDTVEAETTYVYAVRGRNAHGLGPQSGPVTATTPAPPEEEDPPTSARALAEAEFTLGGQHLDTNDLDCLEDTIGDVTDDCTINIDTTTAIFAVVGTLDSDDRLNIKIGRDKAAVDAASTVADESDLRGTDQEETLTFEVGRNLLRLWGDEDGSGGSSSEEHFYRVNVVPYWELNGDELSKSDDCRAATDRTAADITDDDCIVTQFSNTATIQFHNVITDQFNVYVWVNGTRVIDEPDDTDLAGSFDLDLQDGDNAVRIRLVSKTGSHFSEDYDSDKFHYKVKVTDVLVSNLGQVSLGNFNLTAGIPFIAVQFTTGNETGGYRISQVRLEISADSGTIPKVSIHSDSSGQPGSSLKVLTNPGTMPTTNTELDFGADNYKLNPGTSYWIVVERTFGSRLVRVSYTGLTAEDPGAAAGWSIGDNGASLSGGTWSTFTGSIIIPRISVQGTVVPPASDDATLSALALKDASDKAVALVPAFASGTTSYTATVANSISRIKVEPTTNDSGATIEYLDDSGSTLADDDTNTAVFDLDLSVGSNVVKVKVTAEDSTTTRTYTVTVTRAAPPTEVSFGQSAYDVAEGGNVTVTVNLSADPERTVVIPLTATNQDGATGADYSVPASVTFDTGETAKDITFAATQDAIDDDGESVLLGFGALPDRVSASTTTPSATVTVLDDDARGVTVSPTSLPVDEGMTAEYTVVLDSEPTRNVIITINDPTDNTDVTASPASLTFDENDWDTPQTVTVSAVQDADGVNETATVTHTVRGADYASETASDVSVTVVDDETPDVTIAPTGITVLPGGSNQYTVVLDTEPTVQVTVTVTGHADTVLSVSPEQLTFDANDWDTPKTVEVSADDSVTTTETITLAHGLAGGEYRSVTADAVAVTVVKASGTLDFQIGVTASPQALTVPEDKSRSYSAFLSAVPTGDVTVTINLPTGNDLSINKSSLTFTTDNWNVPQAVRVSAADDDDGIPDAPVTIGHTVSGGGYGSGDNFGITVTTLENDTPAVTLSTVSLVIAEGEEATYTVALDTQPSDDVTVVINDPTDNTDVTAAPASLTFTRSNWSAPQTVTVTTVADHDTETDTATVTHTVSGGDYAAVTAKNVDVTVTDGCIVIWCGVLIMEKDTRFTRELRTVSLDDDDFEYKNTYYRLHRPKLYGGPEPQEEYAITVRMPERAWFKLDVRGPLYETKRYLDWTLYVNGVELPFSQAKRVWDDIPWNWGILFKWYGREFHELFPPGGQGTGATLYLSIKETPLADQTPTVTGPPLHLNVETWNRDELWATWARPQMRNDDDRNLYVDSYRVQWKEGSGDWETPADVTEAVYMPSGPSFFESYIIEGLPPGVEYEIRVIATNAVGDSEPSNVATGMIEPD